MESFVDRIIETDRKAREMIEAAQQQQKVLQEETRQKAQQTLDKRAAEDKAQMDKADRTFAEKEKAAMDKADQDYIAAKHALDAAFNAGHDTWVKELTAACTALK